MAEQVDSLGVMRQSPEYHAAHLAFARSTIVQRAAEGRPILDLMREYTADVGKACADEHAGAVEALRAIHHEAEYLVEGARIGEGSRLVGERIVKLAAPHIGGQSSPAGCPACSPDPKVARPPHTCSGEQS
jgi:hypothetical protein